ncbi:hypothetical protein [Methylobacterium platani]|uniref:Uncharacterized protein n=2 Tax=Methylobacterium platani TaxID=427683 RepID=A0A179SDT4_9HYPH|nr:hypothetical protein [Methylobacterium platani]KMO12494.1 hypothetical protein SQ03_24135 [Methylobacterium platani JCM 14648]OAS24650.1 hypothetical protein A5481_13010 [Methylobacterium platani]
MHDRPGGPAPAILPPAFRSVHGAEPLAAVLAPGLQAAFDGCLAEALPADLAGLLERLDRSGTSGAATTGPSRTPRHDQTPGTAAARRFRTSAILERS